MIEFNKQELRRLNNVDNPIAKIKAIDIIHKKNKCFDNDRDIKHNLKLCIGCKIQLKTNACTPWNLFSGAFGIIKDIVFDHDKNPNNNDQPIYILTDFPGYKGPPFLEKFPTYLPITPTTIRCKNCCCQRTQFPLDLAFAKTVHTCQGTSIGKNMPNKPQNVYESAIFDLGPKSVEGWATGLTYSAVSRAQTLGDPDNLDQSAIFFDGKDTNASRFQNIDRGSDNKQYQLYLKKQKWIKHLLGNSIELNYNESEIQSIIDYFNKPI